MTAAPPITPPGVITQEFHTRRDVRRGVIAGVAGNVLEWYDFALFGFFAQQIGTHFFPADNPTASLLAAFGTFAAGFVMRPLGGALFGWVGDKFGRKQALLFSVMAMAFPSFLIGVLPSTETIGIAAPILLFAFRLMQGLAVGGEYGASSVFLVEGAEPGRRGWMGSWAPVGAFAGTLLGSAAGAIVNAVLSPEERVADALKGEVPVGLVVLKAGVKRDRTELVAELVELVRQRVGPVASFKAATVVKRLPKTRSGKIVRGTVKKIADGVAWTVPATIDDPGSLEDISRELAAIGYPRA